MPWLSEGKAHVYFCRFHSVWCCFMPRIWGINLLLTSSLMNIWAFLLEYSSLFVEIRWLAVDLSPRSSQLYSFFFFLSQLKSSQSLGVRSFEIEGEGANSIFTVDEKGDLFVTRSLDREEKSKYHLTARMYDGNKKLIEDSGDFEVQVTDINDNMPVFPGAYKGSIMERSPIGELGGLIWKWSTSRCDWMRQIKFICRTLCYIPNRISSCCCFSWNNIISVWPGPSLQLQSCF